MDSVDWRGVSDLALCPGTGFACNNNMSWLESRISSSECLKGWEVKIVRTVNLPVALGALIPNPKLDQVFDGDDLFMKTKRRQKFPTGVHFPPVQYSKNSVTPRGYHRRFGLWKDPKCRSWLILEWKQETM